MTPDPTRPTNLSAKPKEKVSTPSADSPEPIIIDLGKKDRKQVRKLRKGKPGRLMNRIDDTMDHLRADGTLAADAQPIVVIVKERVRRRGRGIAKMWGLR